MKNALEISGKTAIARKTASKPCKIAYERGYVQSPMIDWGCGRGADVTWLRDRFIDCKAYDPNHFPLHPSIYQDDTPRINYVHCFYVLNTIEDPIERACVIQDIADFLPAGGHAMFAVRSAEEIHNAAYKGVWQHVSDGYRTGSGTFQKGFIGWEIGQLLEANGFKNALVFNSEPLMVYAFKGR